VITWPLWLIPNIFFFSILCRSHIILLVYGLNECIFACIEPKSKNTFFLWIFNWWTTLTWLRGGKNRRTRRKSPPVASHWQTLSHNVVSSTPRHEFYYWMLCSVTLVTLNIFVLNVNIFLFCWCNICILCMIIPMQFLKKKTHYCV